ncbi:putative DNA-binding WGR domain protein [Ciceribacter lividus]|uniref:Putative DNA-binding WGR domain protein n=1 Tax=Ciceribacter lividus TaxID=1197950 RepID=A0A6I7HJG9_9HYPH|nr:WGR domain-containing protein [Ciceribacter lividus]RCW21162.1 putative DNA-binding WGR domain protein [Ciceribacter lividus]
MTDHHICSTELRRVDPERNMARFYLLAIQPTLFGGVSLIRNWGRIGTSGQVKVETYDRPDDAHRAYRRLERVKRRRGYVDPHQVGCGLAV